MTTRQDQRERSIDRLAAHLLDAGLGQTSLRQLAGAAGVSDRMLLYYFNDKADVLSAALERNAAVVADMLARALPEGELFSPADMLQRAAALTTRPEVRRFMRLWIDIVSAAAKGDAPFVAISARIMTGWQAWVESRLLVAPDVDRKAMALAIIATIDGLALIDLCVGRAAAEQARSALPIPPG
jgi:AcrR family transcriptional regulator